MENRNDVLCSDLKSIFSVTCQCHRPILADLMPGASQSGGELLFLEMVNSQDVGGHHDHHRDVEGQQRAEDQEVLVVHLAHLPGRHDVPDVEDGEDGYGGGQEEAEAPGENHFVEDGVFALGPLAQWPSYSSVAACTHQPLASGGQWRTNLLR